MNVTEVSQKPKQKNTIKSMRTFLKKHKRLTITIASFFAVIVIAITAATVLHSAQAKQIQQAQIGKCYTTNYCLSDSYYTEVFCFKEEGCAKLYLSYEDEARQKLDFMYGSLDEIYYDYTDAVNISLLGRITLFGWEIKLNEHNEITHRAYASASDEMTLISLEEAFKIEADSNAQYALTKCEHKFETAQIIKKATCSNIGEEKKVCSICGYEQINKTDKLLHDYVNKICSVCGEKKLLEKSDITANMWYTTRDGLRCQNIKVVDVTVLNSGKGMLVAYYFVCQHCHAIDDSLLSAVPEFNYDINKIYTCEECNKTTTVRIELD